MTAPEGGAIPPEVAALSFDEALAELQRVVGALEAGGQPLEEAIALYERGVALQHHCERLLRQAELRVRRLVDGAGGRPEVRELGGEEGDGGVGESPG